jgi:hypothetical protein
LAGLAGLLEEQHSLERQHIRPDQRLEHVERARVQQEALVDPQPPVQHMDAQPVLQPFAGGGEGRRCDTGDRLATLEQIIHMLVQFAHIFWGHQATHDQEALLVKGDIFLDAHTVGMVVPSGRLCGKRLNGRRHS